MDIGVLSDTHFGSIRQDGPLLERLVESSFPEDVALILHAGDLGAPELLWSLAPRKVLAVRGNVDSPERDLPERRILDLQGFRIGLIHGWGASRGLEQRVVQAFHGIDLDVLVFGHSHVPLCSRDHGLLLFNPGSPTRPRSSSGPTVGLLTLSDKGVEGTILSVDTLQRITL